MKAMIDESGFLHIQRIRRLKKQFCKHGVPLGSLRPLECGDWCPLFGEPVENLRNGITLNICDRSLEFEDDFIDKRLTLP